MNSVVCNPTNELINFTMMMMVEIPDEKIDFEKITTELNELGEKLGVEIKIRNEKLYQAMHQL